jgi:ABC-type multidrug transport system fused ATPase/permease subunit
MSSVPDVSILPADAARSPSLISVLGPLLNEQRGLVLGLAISSVVGSMMESVILAVIAEVAAALVNASTQVHIDIGRVHVSETVGVILVVALVFAIGRLVVQIVISAQSARIVAHTQVRLRAQLFAAFTRASWSTQSRDRDGHLQEIMTNHVAQAAETAVQGTALVVSLLALFVMVVSALALNVGATLVVVIATVGLFALLRPLGILGARRAEALSSAYVDYASEISEANRVVEETRVFGVSDVEQSRVEGRLSRVGDLYYQTQLIARVVSGAYQSLIYLLVVGGLVVLHSAHSDRIASLGAIVLLLVRAGTYGQQAQSAYQFLRQAVPYLERVQRDRLRYASSSVICGRRSLAPIDDLSFEQVSFAYEPGQPVLSEIGFEVHRGETIGIVGPSGAGKSTIVQIALRLRSPTTGSYLVNGVPVEEFNEEDWHRRVCYVPQEPRLLHASVADNIRFYREIDYVAIERAARLAGVHDDVMRWTRRYETVIGPRADAVSGGQRQRICLARALVGEPEVLVLDEPTSALDPQSERLIQESLEGLKQKLTLFVVAHRISTSDICDRVMVIVDGHLEAFDTADRVRSTNSYYRSALSLAVRSGVGS